MPESKSRLPQGQPWEHDWARDTPRPPGTRRLWLAVALAVTTAVACATAIAVNDRDEERKPEARGGQPLSDDETGSGLISFATPSASGSTSAPGSRTPGTAASPTASSSTAAPAADGSATPHSSPSASVTPTTKPSNPTPNGYQRSLQAVNYPDRYWHESGGLIALDQVGGSESREDSTFTVVKGLANSACYTFTTSSGKYLHLRDFVLRAERNDGSPLFAQDATFCPLPSPYADAVMLQPVNHPNYCLRHKNFQLRLDPYGYNTTNRQDFFFRLVAGLA
ncbi:AbfB domain-containing protein [Streptomyces sp. NPDC005820]|uniref:AbfB domain-containing protein n=1 Tax=Streptomyces sp. NPDC005820 TaxID=3157069 RepID=UPI0033D0B196